MAEISILVVEKNPEAACFLYETLTSWDTRVTQATDIRTAAAEACHNLYHLILLGGHTATAIEPHILDEIQANSPDTKFVLVGAKTMSAALRLRAFAWIEEPLSESALFDGVRSALYSQSSEARSRNVLEGIRRTREIVQQQSERLEQLTTTTATISAELSLLLGRRARETEEGLSNVEVLSKLRPLLASIVKEMRADEGLNHYELQLTVLENLLQEIDAAPGIGLPTDCTLSLSEMRILSMIRSGYTTQDIAKRLYVSPETVKTHRRNIRKKLHINGEKTDLASYLRAACGGQG